MLPLLTSAEVKALDQAAEATFRLPVDLLMEHAGRSVAELAASRCKSGRAVVFVGPGNNGGDGLVAARHLTAMGLEVEVVLVAPSAKSSPASSRALDLWRRMGGKIGSEPWSSLRLGDLAIDAVLGTGLSRPPEGKIRDAIVALNEGGRRGAAVIAVDVPSGINADTGTAPGESVQAQLTVTLGAHKRGLWQEPGHSAAGEIRLGSLGLPPAALAGLKPMASLLELGDIQALLPKRPAAAFKNSFGHLMLVAGSPGKTGAAALAIHAALRSGAGLVTAAAREAVLREALAGRPEAMSLALSGEGPLGPQDVKALLEGLSGKQALAVGPGLWRGEGTAAALKELLEGFGGSVVLDADALNAIAGKSGLLSSARGATVVTPHPGELARLLGTSGAEIQKDRFQAAATFARAERTVVVLKGAKTIVASPAGQLAVVPVGGPGLAHGGTGDVLCGLIGGLLAQGLEAFEAAQAGAYLHGVAGDRVVSARGERGLLASDVAEALGPLWAELDA